MLMTVPGTDVRLVYNHFRQSGYRPVVNIPLSGPNLPDSVRFIHLEIEVSLKL